MECKLTEREFGACSRPGLAKDSADLCDGSYTVQLGRRRRCSLSEIGIAYWDYIPKIFGWSAQEDHSPCPARFTYQLVRNLLAALVHDSEVRFDRGHAVVVYDARNPRFQPDGVARLAVEQIHEALGPVRRDRLRMVTWQAIAAALSNHRDFAYLVAGLEEKYGIGAVTGQDDSPSEAADASQAERLREATRMARLVMLRVAGDGGVLDQLEQVPDDRLERLDPGHVEQLIGDLLEATELVREIRADDIPLLGYHG